MPWGLLAISVASPPLFLAPRIFTLVLQEKALTASFTFPAISSSPQNLTVVSTGPHHIHLSWNKYNIYVTGFEIFWKILNSCVTTEFARTQSPNSALNITGLQPFTWYQMTVRAYNSLGSGPNSSYINVRTQAKSLGRMSFSYQSDFYINWVSSYFILSRMYFNFTCFEFQLIFLQFPKTLAWQLRILLMWQSNGCQCHVILCRIIITTTPFRGSPLKEGRQASLQTLL